MILSPMLRWLDESASRFRLRQAQALGVQPKVIGDPYIENFGSLKIGDHFHLSSHPIQSHLVVGPNGRLTIGDGVRIAHGAAISANLQVHIGDRVSIGARVVIMDSDFHAREAGGDIPAGMIVIGDDVTIGDDTVIMRGAQIYQGVTVLAGSVVVGRITEQSIVSGVPARPVRSGTQNHSLPDDYEARIRLVVKQTFNLGVEPEPGDGPEQIKAWDSLGALRLIVNLEQSLGMVLPEGILGTHPTVGGLTERIANLGNS